jgi:hypothetical protein
MLEAKAWLAKGAPLFSQQVVAVLAVKCDYACSSTWTVLGADKSMLNMLHIANHSAASWHAAGAQQSTICHTPPQTVAQ